MFPRRVRQAGRIHYTPPSFLSKKLSTFEVLSQLKEANDHSHILIIVKIGKQKIAISVNIDAIKFDEENCFVIDLKGDKGKQYCSQALLDNKQLNIELSLGKKLGGANNSLFVTHSIKLPTKLTEKSQIFLVHGYTSKEDERDYKERQCPDKREF